MVGSYESDGAIAYHQRTAVVVLVEIRTKPRDLIVVGLGVEVELEPAAAVVEMMELVDVGPTPEVVRNLILFRISSTYRVLFILDLGSPRWDFVSKTGEIVAEIFLVVYSIRRLTKTTRLTSWLTAFQWTNIKAIAEEKLFIKGSWQER
jgi:hypothetical protein